MVETKADAFLRMIRRSRRGHLKIYLGYAAGVGKTYQMLLEGRRLKAEGIDAVVGLAETHGRAETDRLLAGLEIIPRRRTEYRGIVLEEMDLRALLARKPQVALIDELAHTNVPGSPNEKRYEDVQDVLAAGIHVISTLNIQHLESLYDTVERAVGIKVRERLPDSVIAEADQIVNVDLAVEDLRKRLREGQVYTPERIEVALEHFFQSSNLEKLRELTLRELASQIDFKRRGEPADEGAVPDQVMVCLSSRGPGSERLLRYASRLAGRLNRNWYAVYVQTPTESPTMIDVRTHRILSETLTLAKQLGAIVFTYKGGDIVQTLLQFAKEYRVGHIVIGSPRPRTFWDKVRRRANVAERLIREARNITVTVLDTRPEEKAESRPSESQASPGILRWPTLLAPERIIIWNKPVTKAVVLRRLVETLSDREGLDPADRLYQAVLEREAQGSTFFNEGAAFPHVRMRGLGRSLVSLGITRFGVVDEATENPVEVVFLIVSPAESPEDQVKLLAMTSQLARNRLFRKSLHSCRTPDDVLAEVDRWASIERPKTD